MKSSSSSFSSILLEFFLKHFEEKTRTKDEEE
jgi:hypothetical protein